MRGDVFFERCFVSTTHFCGCVPYETIERAIIETGVGRTMLSTDLGQPETPPPAEGMRLYAERLNSTGFSVDQIRTMMQANPEVCWPVPNRYARSPERRHPRAWLFRAPAHSSLARALVSPTT